jgi:nucleotide-binding universal stress UspA family protein
MYKTVIWATDGSEGADTALTEARRLVDSSGGRIVAVHCDQRLTGRAASWPALADEDDRRIKIYHQVDELRRDGFEVDLVLRPTYREPADVVAAIAEEFRGDVIVCGTRGHGALSGTLHGSFSHRLLHAAHCPVLAIPQVEIRARPTRVKDQVHA